MAAQMTISKGQSGHEQVGTLSSASRLMLKNAIELTNNFILNNHASTNMFSAIFFGILDPEFRHVDVYQRRPGTAADLEPG